MVRFIFIIIGLYLFYVVLKEWILPKKSGKKSGSGLHEEKMVRDTVCGMFLPVRLAKRLEKDGKVYYFCSDKCMQKFLNEEGKDDN